MSLKQSAETSTVLVKSDNETISSCAHPHTTDTKSEELDQTSYLSEMLSEKLKKDDSNCTVNSKKSVISYEKINGFTHSSSNHEAMNGEIISNCDNDDSEIRNSETLTTVGAYSDRVCSIPSKADISVPAATTEKNMAKCDHTVHSHLDQNQGVEELTDKLARTPLSLNEDSTQRSLLSSEDEIYGISYLIYESERQMPDIMRLITKDLSEPYSIYTYRYFIHNWPKLCFLAMDETKCVGAIVCKLDVHKKMVRRGYIAMLAVDSEYRRKRIGSTLVTKAIHAMIRDDCDEVVLETEITNQAALHLYENLGFVRDKRLFRYYLNGVDALRLKLWLR